jgi:hypothetical protein
MRSQKEHAPLFADYTGARGRAVLLPIFLTAVIVTGLTVFGPECLAGGRNTIPFKRAQIRIEVNSTDGDAGLQLDLDAEPWRIIEIENPAGNIIFSVKSLGKLKTLGNTELFTESNEPPFDELPLRDFLKMFPAGKYEFSGMLIEGGELESVARLTHNMPCGPVIASPAEGEELEPDAPVVIDWDPVTSKLDKSTGDCDNSSHIEIAGYQVIVVREDPLPQIIYSVHLPADATGITVSPEFIEPGASYTFEVLSKEPGGNQTITEGSFITSN